jgi:hypothetical protein
MQVRKSGLVISCQVTAFLIDMWCKPNPETGGLKQVYSCLNFRFVNRACRRDDTDGISLPKPRWFYDSIVFDN